MGGGQPGPGADQDFSKHQNWNFQSSIDPEELFRKIFGQGGFSAGNFNEDFAESRFGFGASQEVSVSYGQKLTTFLTISFF